MGNLENGKIRLEAKSDVVHVYVLCDYRTPIYGKEKREWLHGDTWKKIGDAYFQIDGIGRRTGKMASCIDEILETESTERKSMG